MFRMALSDNNIKIVSWQRYESFIHSIGSKIF